MARIPLSNIPDVPSSLQREPGRISVPDFNISAGRAAGMLRLSGVDSAPFVAAAGGGLAAMGQSIQKAAGVLGELSERMMESKNAGDVARADAIMTDARSRFLSERSKLPESEWEGLWVQKYRPEMEKGVEGLGLSQWTRDRIHPAMVQFDATTRVNARHDAFEVQRGRDRQDLMNGYNAALDRNDPEVASDYLGLLRTSRHITPEQEQALWMDGKKKVRANGLMKTLNADPMAFKAEMDEAKKSGKSDAFPWMGAEEIARYSHVANAEVHQRRQEAAHGAQLAVASGEVFDGEGIRKAFPDLESRQLTLLEKQIRENRQYDPAKDGPLFAQARGMVAAYNGLEDPDGSKAQAIQETISGLPRREAGMLSASLSQQWASTWKGGKPMESQQRRLAYWTKFITDLGENGRLGKTGRDPNNWSKITNEKEAFAYGEMINQKIDVLEEWSAKTPGADDAVWKEQMTRIIGGDLVKNSSAWFMSPHAPLGSDWGPYGGGGLGFPRPSRPQITSDNIRQKVQPPAPASIRADQR